MIDYLKIHSLPVQVDAILCNDLLVFPLSNVATTGEIMDRAQVAHWQELRLIVKGDKVSLKGSLHKHFEGGTNHRDFKLSNIHSTVDKLGETFSFDPSRAIINFLEVGVNIPLKDDPTNLIKTLVIYRNNPFTQLNVKGKGYGRKCETQQFTIKVYNKSLQYGLNEPLLRFELKVKRMKYLERYGITGLTLADLKDPSIYPALLKMLLDVLNGILMFDPSMTPDKITTLNDRELFVSGRHPEYWQELPRQRKSEKLKLFGELAATNVVKKQLEEKITSKWNELTTPDKITTFTKDMEIPKTGQNNTTIDGEFVLICTVTSLPFKKLAPEKKYLTQADIRWYFENDFGSYQKNLESLLTEKWKIRHRGDTLETWFEEIAHKIRCRLSNTRRNPVNNTRRSFANVESKGFKLWDTETLVDPKKMKLIS